MFADANGNIFVVPGDHIPGIPDFRFKLGAEYQITNPWKLGADLNIIGSQYLVGDEANQLPRVPAYWVVNLTFDALGDINFLPTLLAAWSPDLLFALAGAYLLLRTPT